MRLFHAAVVALACLPTALSTMQFIKPPAFTALVEPSKNPVLVTGTTLDIEWTPAHEGKKLSVVLYQVNATKAATYNGQWNYTEGPFEFITHDQVGATAFTWIVGTTKDLTISSMFAIAVWEEGTAITDSATNIFNITKAETTTSTSSAASTTLRLAVTSSASSTASTTSSTTVPAATTTTPVTTPLSATDQPATSTALSTGAAVGVGIGTAFGVMLLVAVGWYCGRRRSLRKQDVNRGMVEDGKPPVVVAEHALPDKYACAEMPAVRSPVFEAPFDNDRRYELS